ncbi:MULTISPECIES: TonB-dependent receptor [unclassified Polynucleobacter]|jgi:iron complex outermembrane receptor protein|uniref:TonB-dependent receptor n=1 Tax=unclassified Polynucleobacter TaxID=2640945 RepID=UPI000BD03F04|nr:MULTISPECIES: TonB-dependent receptor [unclassified Polynucleobacter]OYY18433.1 MAG: TonB-dependent receptor [Polynucleobacter sp. 35-46-11]OZA78030.1 MAG: TonB-dependent receptor [Polynucleobacter sp. 39-46-10]
MHQIHQPLAKQKLIYVLISGLISTTAFAQSPPSLEITSTGSQEATQSILTPTKILRGDELLNKLGSTLGATLANELGVSATGYGAGSSRPVIRGLEGSRVQILQNGLSVGDVSNISQDHAVGNNMQNAHQVEILRGAAALLYGSGSSGGLVNVVNDRILTNLPDRPTGAVNTSYETVNNGRAGAVEVDGAFSSVAVHVDTAINNANNYRIPGNSTQSQGEPAGGWTVPPGGDGGNNYSGKLPNSFNNQNNLGVGVSYIGQNGYTGVSAERLNNNYGIPTPEGGSINQSQNRYDLQHQTRDPFAGFSSFKFSAANSNYNHTEFNNAGEAASLWKNIANEARFELAHNPLLGWKGTFGAQVSAASLNATEVGTGSYAIVPPTKTNSNALFWIEEGKWNSLQGNLGLRYNNVAQKPNLGTGLVSEPVDTGVMPTITLQNRNFNLMSYSAGGLWNFMQGHGAGVAYTVSQRAPSAQELYSYGAHESTATFDIGNPNLDKETSHNLEFNIQKTSGLMRAKASVYANRFNNYIYGYYTGQFVPSAGDFSVVVAQQAAATIKGVEGELTYNWREHGLGGRVFGDASQGTFDAGGNLPLQPAPRLGAEIAHQQNGWLTNATYIYSYQQNRLASWEQGPAPSYNLLNAGISYTEKIKDMNWTVYMNLKNLLNEQIRYATTPMAVRLYAPQPGRSLMVGLRGTF